MKTSELCGHLLDYWTGKALGKRVIIFPHQRDGSFFCAEKTKDYASISTHTAWNPSENWNIVGPLIQSKEIDLHYGIATEALPVELDIWVAMKDGVRYDACGPDPLIAVCRLIVWMEYGDEVPSID